jgi:DNA mismatch repair protein MSH5
MITNLDRFVNSNSIEALQVITTEAHPNSHNQGSKTQGSKEGLSVYGLFQDYTRTSHGKSRLRQWFLRPTTLINVINDRLDTIAVFTLPANDVQLKELVKNLKSVGNLKSSLRNLRKGALGLSSGGSASVKMWAQLLAFTFAALCIRDAIREMDGSRNLNIFQRLMNGLNGPALANVGGHITHVIDIGESSDLRTPVVKQGLDEELDQLKRRFDGLDSWLREVAKHISSLIPNECRDDLEVVEVAYFPRIGFVIEINEEAAEAVATHFGTADRPWELAFIAG